MLHGRAVYIWHLKAAKGGGSIDDLVAKARQHKISSLWIKLGDGEEPFDNVVPPLSKQLAELITKGSAAGISVLGYHVPWCATQEAARREVEKVVELVETLNLAGVVVDNEDGAPYFKGGSNEARIYASGLHSALASAGRILVMSSNDIPSLHPGSQAKTIGHFIDYNAPQVYYGGSPSVKSRLDWARKENEDIPAPFFPVGAAFVSKPSVGDGGCKSASDCAKRAKQFIALVSDLNRKDPSRYPGYGFWNWEEAPSDVWKVLETTDVFVGAPAIEAALPAAPAAGVNVTRGPSEARISMAELQRMMRDPSIPDAELKQYFIPSPQTSRPFSPSIIPNPDRVSVAEPLDMTESAMLMNVANGLERLRREAKFDARRATGDTSPVLVCEGDSWFLFPIYLQDIMDDLHPNYNIWSVAAAGDTLQNMVIDNPEYMTALRQNAGIVKAFLFSGGGNDIVGSDKNGNSVLAQILKPYKQGQPPEWYIDTPETAQKLQFIEDCYRTVISNVASEFPALPVICHGYDYAIPGGWPGDPRDPKWAANDHWLGQPMRDTLKILDPALQRSIIHLLIDRLNERIKGLCGGNNAGGAYRNAWHVDVRGTVDTIALWADELHPTDPGFSRVTTKFASVLRSTVPPELEQPVAETATPHNGDDDSVDAAESPGAWQPSALEAAQPWRVAKSLLQLRNQLNARFPARRKTEDGTIGDAAHAARTSDHNPWVKDGAMGVVTAVDITNDPASGCSGDWLAEAIRKSRDSRVKYIIWNRRICSSSSIGSASPWEWRPYHGKNPHDKHIHISVKPEKSAYDSENPWLLTAPKEIVGEPVLKEAAVVRPVTTEKAAASVTVEVPLRITLSLGPVS